jgi:hypothetical protein
VNPDAPKTTTAGAKAIVGANANGSASATISLAALPEVMNQDERLRMITCLWLAAYELRRRRAPLGRLSYPAPR